jgi:apolipoprotein N-acyltransferase
LRSCAGYAELGISGIGRSTGHFAPGPRERALGFEAHKIAVSICLEDLEAWYISHLVAMDEAQLLVSLVDDAWFPGEQARHWHFVLSKLRAIEQRRFLVRATNTGISAIVDSSGKVVARAPAGQAALLSGRVRWLGGRTVYSYVGNAFSWLLSGVAFALALLNRSAVRRWWSA